MKNRSEQYRTKKLDKIPQVLLFFLFFGISSSLLFANSDRFNERTYSKSYYANGRIKAEGWMVDSKKDGYWKFYYWNGQLKKEGHLSKDKPSKYWYFYRDNGFIESEGHYDEGVKTKWWLYYDNKENVNHKCQLKNGQKNGYCLIYNNNKIVKAAKFKNGKKIKEWTDYNSFKKDNKLSDLK